MLILTRQRLTSPFCRLREKVGEARMRVLSHLGKRLPVSGLSTPSSALRAPSPAGGRRVDRDTASMLSASL
jgi:hypothetical protein